MLHARITIIGTLLALSLTPTPVSADPPPPADRKTVHAQHSTQQVVDKATSELEWQLNNGGIPISAWRHVAQCETQGDWRNRGTYAGGLGIFTRGRFTPKHLRNGHAGTWERWGGEEFAPTPSKATIVEQVVVANRIAIFGWSTSYTLNAGYKGAEMKFTFSRPGIGVTGWGCVKTHKYLKRTLCEAGRSTVPSWKRHCRKP